MAPPTAVEIQRQQMHAREAKQATVAKQEHLPYVQRDDSVVVEVPRNANPSPMTTKDYMTQKEFEEIREGVMEIRNGRDEAAKQALTKLREGKPLSSSDIEHLSQGKLKAIFAKTAKIDSSFEVKIVDQWVENNANKLLPGIIKIDNRAPVMPSEAQHMLERIKQEPGALEDLQKLAAGETLHKDTINKLKRLQFLSDNGGVPDIVRVAINASTAKVIPPSSSRSGMSMKV